MGQRPFIARLGLNTPTIDLNGGTINEVLTAASPASTSDTAVVTAGYLNSYSTAWSAISGDTNAVKSNGYIIDAGSTTVTLTLPASPSVGDRVSVSVADASNTITIARNGNLLIGGTADLTLDSAGDGLELIYTGAGFGWATTTELNVASDPAALTVTDLTVLGDITATAGTHAFGASSINGLTLTDQLIARDVLNSSLQIAGGTAIGTGGGIELFGSTEATTPNYNRYLSTNHQFRSTDGSTDDVNVEIDYVGSGGGFGTFTGSLTFSGGTTLSESQNTGIGNIEGRLIFTDEGGGVYYNVVPIASYAAAVDQYNYANSLFSYSGVLGTFTFGAPVDFGVNPIISSGPLTLSGSVSIESGAGIDYNPGIDTDVDIATIGVSGLPRFWWDESGDVFAFTKGLTSTGAISAGGGVSGSFLNASGGITYGTTINGPGASIGPAAATFNVLIDAGSNSITGGAISGTTGTFSGNLSSDGALTTLGSGSSLSQVVIDGGAGSVRDLVFATGGLARFIFRGANGTAESGSNAGSDFQIQARTDAGGLIDTPLQIVRVAGGAISLNRPVVGSSTINVSPDGSATHNLSKLRIDTRFGDFFVLSHYDLSSTGGYGFAQANVGDTYINAALGRTGYIRVNNTNIATWTASLIESSVPVKSTAVGVSSLIPGGFISESALPAFHWYETGVAADNGRWDMSVNSEQFRFRVLNDAISAAGTIFTVDRTGTSIDSIAFGAPINVGPNALQLASGETEIKRGGANNAILESTVASCYWQYVGTGGANGFAGFNGSDVFEVYQGDGSTPAAITGGAITGTTGAFTGLLSTDGNLIVGDTVGGSQASLDGAAGFSRLVRVLTGSSARWAWGGNTALETGGDAGTNWYLNAYNDAGSYIDSPIVVVRASGGNINFAAARTINCGPINVGPNALQLASGETEIKRGGANNAILESTVASCYWQYVGTGGANGFAGFNGSDVFEVYEGDGSTPAAITGGAISGTTGTFSDGLRVTGSFTPASGVGLEAEWDGVRVDLLSFDRDTTAYQPMRYRASNHVWQVNASIAFVIGADATFSVPIDAGSNAITGGAISGTTGDFSGTLTLSELDSIKLGVDNSFLNLSGGSVIGAAQARLVIFGQSAVNANIVAARGSAFAVQDLAATTNHLLVNSSGVTASVPINGTTGTFSGTVTAADCVVQSNDSTNNALFNAINDSGIQSFFYTARSGFGAESGNAVVQFDSTKQFSVRDGTNRYFGVSPTAATFSVQAKSTISGGGSTSGFQIESTGPSFGWRETDQGADEKQWDIIATGSLLKIRAVADNNSSAGDIVTLSRSGTTPTGAAFGVRTAINAGTSGAYGLTVNAQASSGELLELNNFNGNPVLQINTDGSQDPFFTIKPDSGSDLFTVNPTAATFNVPATISTATTQQLELINTAPSGWANHINLKRGTGAGNDLNIASFGSSPGSLTGGALEMNGVYSVIWTSTYNQMSVQTRVVDGTAASPSICFNSDQDTGIYRVSANVLGVTAGGVACTSIGANVFNLLSGQRLRINGQAGTPSSPAAGDITYNTATNKHQGYDGTSWNDLY